MLPWVKEDIFWIAKCRLQQQGMIKTYYCAESVKVCLFVSYKMRCYFPYPASHEAAQGLYISGTVNKCK